MRLPQIILAAVVTLSVFSCIAQSDTVIVYTPSTQEMDTILPVSFDTTLQADHTGSFAGYLNGEALLSNDIPTTELMAGVNHTELQLASEWFDVAEYPMRAAIKLGRWTADSIQHVCSGMMVSNSMVLTAAHCVMGHSDGEFYVDGLVAFPGFDNGEENSQVQSSAVERIYVFKRIVGSNITSGYDIALLELEEPMGAQTGWIGLGYETDDFVENHVFHKFSYPGEPHPILDSLRDFNGDTMYYDYGEIDVLEPFLGISSPDGFGRVGQSGSSFFYTNGQDSYSLGVMSWSTNYRHTRITNSVYHQLKPIIEGDEQVGVAENETLNVGVYPNPTTGRVRIELKETESLVHVAVRNNLGQQVFSAQFSNGTQSEVDIPGPPGLYLIEVSSEEGRAVRRIVKF